MDTVITLGICLLILALCEGKASVNPKDKECLDLSPYNSKYPLTEPTIKQPKGGTVWRIAIISDRDKASKYNKTTDLWLSRFKRGSLHLYKNKRRATIKWDPNTTDSLLNYDLAQKGRGMELSELIVFDGKLYTCCDRTGMVYQLIEDGKNMTVLPFVHLNDGDGKKNKGYKCEWMSVRDNKLWIGSTGKEWSTPTGVFMNHDPEWIKIVDRAGVVENVNWTDYYLSLRQKSGYSPPGYFFHESAVWSTTYEQWFFLPRKVSNEKYNNDLDEKRCGNLLLRMTPDFTKLILKTEIGPLNVSRGFSSFKFVPKTHDNIFVALKTVEVGDDVESYIGVYNIHGHTLMNETFISNEKFEGVEFI